MKGRRLIKKLICVVCPDKLYEENAMIACKHVRVPCRLHQKLATTKEYLPPLQT